MLYRMECRPLHRKKGDSATGLAAYMLDLIATNPFDRKVYRQEDRHEHVIDVAMFSPTDDLFFKSAIEVFQAIDKYENRKDATLGKEYEITLQHELTAEQNIEIVKNLCEKISKKDGLYCVAAIHH